MNSTPKDNFDTDLYREKVINDSAIKESMITEIDDDYVPTADEEYMNLRQLEYFRRKLLQKKHELLAQLHETADALKGTNLNEPDLLDRVSKEAETFSELRNHRRAINTIRSIDEALNRIKRREYGYCELSGVEIGIKRLEIDPTTTLSVAVKEIQEKYEGAHYREEDEEEF